MVEEVAAATGHFFRYVVNEAKGNGDSMSIGFEGLAVAISRWLGGAMIGSKAFDAVIEVAGKTVGIELAPREPIDKRLANIEIARQSLSSALGAIDELKAEAERNAAQVEALRAALGEVSEEHKEAQKKLVNVRKLADIDTATVQSVMRVPTPKSVWIERGFSFCIGALASLLASWIWWRLMGQ